MKIRQKHFKSMDDLNEWAKLQGLSTTSLRLISINVNSASIIVFYWGKDEL